MKLSSLHIISVENANESIGKFLDFIEYLNSHPVAFNKYKDTKFNLKNESFVDYKRKKSDVVMEILAEIEIWKQNKKRD